jgi:hypothetical protein
LSCMTLIYQPVIYYVASFCREMVTAYLPIIEKEMTVSG